MYQVMRTRDPSTTLEEDMFPYHGTNFLGQVSEEVERSLGWAVHDARNGPTSWTWNLFRKTFWPLCLFLPLSFSSWTSSFCWSI